MQDLKSLMQDLPSDQILSSVNFEFDLKNDQIHAASKDLGAEGNPVFKWELNQ